MRSNLPCSETDVPNGAQTAITAAVEGDLDEALLRRVLGYADLLLGTVHGRRGKVPLLQSINGYNNAARFSPWVVLVDLDGDGACAPECLPVWLPAPSEHMCFRVVVRAAEAWVLADRQRAARWLGVPISAITNNPDELEHPKRDLINLARQSRYASVRNDLVPREGSGRAVGPLYTARLMDFIRDEAEGWRPAEASQTSNSLARCVARLQDMAEA
jgi:hypothetical protein